MVEALLVRGRELAAKDVEVTAVGHRLVRTPRRSGKSSIRNQEITLQVQGLKLSKAMGKSDSPRSSTFL